MKKVTAFVGSAHKKNTHNAAAQFLNGLRELGDYETEIVTLSDYRLAFCRGCLVCFEKGEQFCPLKDDRDLLFEKLAASDGVVFATPNYTWDMSGIMKTFLDRFGFIFHRPRFFGKAFTSIVTQAVSRGEKIVDTLDFTAKITGFRTLKGITVTGFNPCTEKQQQKIDRDIAALSRRFSALLAKPADAEPSLEELAFFHIGRGLVRHKAAQTSLDYRYYAERGWLTADYYYPTRLGLLKRAAGSLMDAAMGAAQRL